MISDGNNVIMDRNEKTDRYAETCHEADLSEDLVRRIVRKTAQTVPPVSGDIFTRIETAIESGGRPALDRPAPKMSVIREHIRQWLDLFFRPQVGWGLAAVQAAALCLFLVFSPGRQAYNTLSMSHESTVAGIHLYVMFDDTATVGEIEKLLRQMHGRIIDGPAGHGIYTITFETGSAATTAELLKKLQQDKIVTFAEQTY